jgi:hypothetical protein
MYDVTTWEEIKYKVEEGTRSLITMITREISTDRSLQELYPIYPVPWQLGEVLRQRAETWLNRLYAICCEAQKAKGKAIDYSFNLAVWAYCIEPFITREIAANACGYRTSAFMELLLCAVGSSPDKRKSLTMSHRQCCDRVRERLLKQWYDRLHGLNAATKEAIRVLTLHRQMEARAALIPPGPPAQPAPADRERVSSPPQQQNVATAHETQPPISTALSVESKSEVVGDSEPSAPVRSVVESKWEDIEISFISDERVQIRNGKKLETLNYTEFGFEDARNENPNQAWAVLRRLAERDGVLENAMEARLEWAKVEKRIQEIRSVLRQRFGIASDPIPFFEKSRVQGKKSGYNSRFKISCARSYRT